jgi:hypothetical protein
LALIGAGAALLTALAVVVVLLSGGGGSGANSAETTDSEAASPVKRTAEAKPKTKTLTKPELINRADAICEASQNSYKSVFSQELEERPDVAYATTLAGISQRGVLRFRKLAPPPNLEAAFEDYVKAQERVMLNDRRALAAAEAGDASAYLAARERRDAEAAERYDLARELGLRACSPNRG